MTIKALVDYLFDMINTGQLHMSDKVPAEVIQSIDAGHESVAEYLAKKYDIGEGGYIGGQISPD